MWQIDSGKIYETTWLFSKESPVEKEGAGRSRKKSKSESVVGYQCSVCVIDARRPDINVIDKKERKKIIIDIAVLDDVRVR